MTETTTSPVPVDDRILSITDNAVTAIRANFKVRNQKAFSETPRQVRLVAERKRQIRQWVEVVRVLQNPLNHNCVLARLTENGLYSGRPLMTHDLRNRVITGGSDAAAKRALDASADQFQEPDLATDTPQGRP